MRKLTTKDITLQNIVILLAIVVALAIAIFVIWLGLNVGDEAEPEESAVTATEQTQEQTADANKEEAAKAENTKKTEDTKKEETKKEEKKTTGKFENAEEVAERTDILKAARKAGAERVKNPGVGTNALIYQYADQYDPQLDLEAAYLAKGKDKEKDRLVLIYKFSSLADGPEIRATYENGRAYTYETVELKNFDRSITKDDIYRNAFDYVDYDESLKAMENRYNDQTGGAFKLEKIDIK